LPKVHLAGHTDCFASVSLIFHYFSLTRAKIRERN